LFADVCLLQVSKIVLYQYIIQSKEIDMIYFKTVKIDSIESDVIETKIRQASIKSTSHLDLTSSSNYIGSEKKFYGYETEKYLMITRIRSPLESYLPNLIVKFDKQHGFNEYKLRFSLFASFLVGMFLLFGISILEDLIKFKQFDFDILVPIILFASFILFMLLEIKITNKIIYKVMMKKNE
jgi:hypothetical protein